MSRDKKAIRSDASLRGKVRDVARSHGLRPQEVLQMYLFERLLARLESGPYAGNFVLKGGLLVASMIGLAGRTTMDMDTTVRALPMGKGEVERVLREVCATDAGDGMEYSLERVEPIREDDEYANWRAHLRVRYGRIDAPIKVDITTGDIVTPGAVPYGYPLMFGGGTLEVPAYPLETVLAEKLETCVRRGVANTRGRDYYDLWALLRTRGDEIDPPTLRSALLATAERRGSVGLMPGFEAVLSEVRESPAMLGVWHSYTLDTPYAEGIPFDDAVDAAVAVGRIALS